MNTPAHLLLGAAVCARPANRALLGAAVLGALWPDASLYVLAGWALFVQQIPPETVFGELYFSESWQAIFAIDNAIPLWAGLFLICSWQGWRWGQVFAGAGLLHLVSDLLLHAGDGRPHFWPFSGYVYDSPVSYWDSAHHAGMAVPVLAIVAALCFVVLWRRGIGWGARGFFGLCLAAELWVALQWWRYF